MNASKVRALRKTLHMSQVELAAAVMVHPMTVSKWERGIATPHPVHVRSMQALAPKKG